MIVEVSKSKKFPISVPERFAVARCCPGGKEIHRFFICSVGISAPKNNQKKPPVMSGF